MNSVGELVEIILSRIPLPDTNELAEAVESWRGASGGAFLLDDPRWQKAWDLPIVKRNLDNILREADQVSRARVFIFFMYHGTEREWGLTQCFVSFITWDITGLLRILVLPNSSFFSLR